MFLNHLSEMRVTVCKPGWSFFINILAVRGTTPFLSLEHVGFTANAAVAVATSAQRMARMITCGILPARHYIMRQHAKRNPPWQRKRCRWPSARAAGTFTRQP